MSKLLDVIRERRSDRHFANKPLEAETVEALLDAFRWAPSSNNRQPWRVLIVSSAEAHRIFDDALSAGNKQWAPVAPLKMVIIGVPEEQPERNGMQNFLLDVGFAMENMMVQGYAWASPSMPWRASTTTRSARGSHPAQCQAGGGDGRGLSRQKSRT